VGGRGEGSRGLFLFVGGTFRSPIVADLFSEGTMKTAYFDCFAGISGDMILGAIVSAGYPIEQLNQCLAGLDLNVHLRASDTQRHGLAATHVSVEAPHEHVHRGLKDVLAILRAGNLPAPVLEKAEAIFRNLAAAEASVHGVSVDEVHFHEVGALDAIADVVGAVAGLHGLGVERVSASRLRFGTGETRGSHGSLPIPVPAVVALCKGLPAERTSLPFEMVTPTGAAILTTLAATIGEPLVMKTEVVGYGAGTRDSEQIANVLRLEIGESADSVDSRSPILIETNIDDASPEIHGYLCKRLLDLGALDAWLTPVIMKKGRPGVVVSVLAQPADVDTLAGVLFSETTTIGIRTTQVERRVLDRRIETVETPWGTVHIKRTQLPDGRSRFAPEYEDCARIAQEKGVPMLDVYQAALRAGPVDP